MASFVPPTYALSIYQGDSVAFSYRARARTSTGGPGPYIDLTDCVPKAQLRTSETDGTVIAEFTATLGDQTLAAEKGMVRLALSHTQTAALSEDTYVWDTQVTFPDGTVRTYLRGPVTLVKEVTR